MVVLQEDFNTTLVWVQPKPPILDCKSSIDFNTTLVWVQPEKEIEVHIIKGFQYNTCLGSTYLYKTIYIDAVKFQYNTCLGSTHL